MRGTVQEGLARSIRARSGAQLEIRYNHSSHVCGWRVLRTGTTNYEVKLMGGGGDEKVGREYLSLIHI